MNELHLSRRALLAALAISMLFSISGCGESVPDMPDIPESLKQYVQRTDKEDFPLGSTPSNPESPGFTVKINTDDFSDTQRILSDVQKLGHVQRLSLDYDQRLIKQIIECKDLEVLHLGCRVTGDDSQVDFSWIDQLENLKELVIGYASYARYKEAKLACPPGLQYLSCYGLPIESLEQVVGKCEGLEDLDASFNSELKDAFVISKLPLLKKLKISQKPLSEACKKGLVFDLESLVLVECDADLQDLKGNAEQLRIFGSKTLKSLNGFENIKVSHLHLINCNQLEDIDALASANAISFIELDGCTLNGQPITEDDLSAVKKANPNLKIKIKK